MRVKVLRPLAARPLDLRLLNARLDDADHAVCDPVLKVEDVPQLAVEFVGPEMSAGFGLDQLRRDTQALACFSYSAFERKVCSGNGRSPLTPGIPGLRPTLRARRPGGRSAEKGQGKGSLELVAGDGTRANTNPTTEASARAKIDVPLGLAAARFVPTVIAACRLLADLSRMNDESDPLAKAHRGKAGTIPYRHFLETVHPSVEKRVAGLWKTTAGIQYLKMAAPELRLYCPKCGGERTFRAEGDAERLSEKAANVRFVSYLCGDCRRQVKSFSLWIIVGKEPGVGTVYKYGEKPAFGVPVPDRLLCLFGDDRDNFIKGRQCENQGLGVGAFAYYRRVVENHKNEIFDEIIRVCETMIDAPQGLIEELNNAKKETSFTKAMGKIKTALPQGLLINGHNPLTALHGALSVSLHGETDEECLASAHDVRLVLADLIEKMSSLRQNNRELQSAVQHLIKKKSGV